MTTSKPMAAPVAVLAVLAGTAADAQESKVEEVVVTSTALRESALEIAQPTEVLAGDELRRRAAASLGETLSKELGVSSSYFGPGASRPVVRGLGGFRVQTLQDGLATLDVAGLSPDHAATVESVVAQQIEVVKGPASLLYGSGAAGGLVNVVTGRVPRERRERALGGAVELRGDTATGERTGALSLDAGRGAFALHGDYFDRTTDDVEIPDGSIPNSASDSRGGALGASLIGETARGGGSWSRHETVYGIPGEETAFIDLRQDRYDAKAEVDLEGTVSVLRLSGSYSDYAHTELEAPGEPGTIFNQDAYDLRFEAEHAFGSGWRGTIGAQYLSIDFEALGDEAYVPPTATRGLGLFLFEERHLDAWTFELGARAERQTIDGAPGTALPAEFDETAVSFSAGTVWKFADDHRLAVNVTRTQRNPQAAELYANGPHLAVQRFEIGNPALAEETAVTTDVSLRRTGERVRWTLSAYYNDYGDYVFANPTGGVVEDLPVFVYQQAGAKIFGFEAETVLPLLSRGGHSLELRLAADQVRGELKDGSNLPQMPPPRFGGGLDYRRGDLRVGLEAFRHRKQDDTAAFELPTDGYTLLDTDVSYRFPFGEDSLLVFVRGTNLLDEEARQHASPLKDIAPLPGRSLHVGARVSF
jgi:iron complex outermembrane recepter protein